MSLTELKERTEELPSVEFFEFARWIRELEADAWDKEIAADLESGRFDAFFEAVKTDVELGNVKPL